MEPSKTPQVLLVEDAAELALLYQDYLRDEPIELEHVATGRAALARVEVSPPRILLLDLKLPDMDGREVLAHIVEADLPVSVLMITAYGDIDTAVQAMRAGASDFLTKPFRAERLQRAVREYLPRGGHALHPDAKRGRPGGTDFAGFVGTSRAMRAVYRTIECAARSHAAVFVSGETGTGKELCAQAVHQRSARRRKPFIALNCGAIPKDLMESEIFGHAKGAYTGALSARAGAAKLADGGTLFLDEICEMDPGLQAKLLRFIQSGTFRPLGSDRTETVDVRLICATNKDPMEEIAAGRFREDLYYRINVVPVHVPPLRERREDIVPIARSFLSAVSREEGKDFMAFSPHVEAIFQACDWPGNVRQLHNVIRSAVVLHDGKIVSPDMLPAPLNRAPAAPAPAAANGAAHGAADNGEIRPLRLMERELIEDAIACCEGNVVEAARLLQISPSTIYRKRLGWGRKAVA